jgi:hypothetical protein
VHNPRHARSFGQKGPTVHGGIRQLQQ